MCSTRCMNNLENYRKVQQWHCVNHPIAASTHSTARSPLCWPVLNVRMFFNNIVHRLHFWPPDSTYHSQYLNDIFLFRLVINLVLVPWPLFPVFRARLHVPGWSANLGFFPRIHLTLGFLGGDLNWWCSFFKQWVIVLIEGFCSTVLEDQRSRSKNALKRDGLCTHYNIQRSEGWIGIVHHRSGWYRRKTPQSSE